MFAWYKDLIEKLFSAVFEKSGEVISFLDYLSVIGFSLLLVLVFVLTLALLGSAVAGPFFGYRKMLAGVKKSMEEFNENSDLTAFQTLKRKLWTRRITFWCLFAFIYLPIAIPTVLYIISLITNLFV